ncbi:MAG: tetratricopeptide repeat protein [Chloroflexaceae bacterium]|nr:tetratricopeptide repeat protein [Chloroflexaceae bacterium]
MQSLVPHPILAAFQEQRFCGVEEAVSLFVDISGFTTLTETLMQHKKDGAEALTNALNNFFRPLVRAVYVRGGFITTFAGDAFTALFPIQGSIRIEEAALQATRTAFFIQQFFVEHPNIETPYGTFPINVKVGIGSGEAEWGILGETTDQESDIPLRTYFFRGQAIDRCAHAEHEASRGDIIAHQAILNTLHPLVAYTGAAPHGKLLSLRAENPETPIRIPPVSSTFVRSFLPGRVLDLFASKARGEFRQAAIVFLSFQEPPEPHALGSFTTNVLKLTAAYDGYFNKLDFGDKGGVILLIFGAPVAHERDIERAANALLTLREWESTVPWRAGITSGIVYAGLMGGDERCEYTTIGDVVNLAARLMMKAPWGEIWTGPSVAEHLQARGYQIESRGPTTFKGKSRPVNVSRLISRQVVEETGFYRGTMVGRQNELVRMVEWMGPIFRRQGAGFLTIYGEAGIGKSRLAYELRQRLLDALTLRWFICPADNILSLSLNPFRHMLRTYFQQSAAHSAETNKARFTTLLDTLIAEVRQHQATDPEAEKIAAELDRTRSFLGALIDLTWKDSLYEQLEPRLRFENMLQAFKTLIQAEGLRYPVVLQIENLQWLDADSHELLKQLSRMRPGVPLALLCLSRYRDDGSKITLPLGPEVPQQTMEIAMLSPDETCTFVTDVMEGPITDDLLRFLVEKTGGNPFFLEQIALDLRERGAVIPNEHTAWSLRDPDMPDLPTSVTAVLVARLDRLASNLRQVVQTASVLGREFALQILTRILSDDAQISEHIHQVEQERIWSLTSEGRCIFLHSLLCDTAYHMQLRVRLNELHTLAASTIEQLFHDDLSPHYADLAHHYGRAGKRDQERHYAYQAGEQAAARFANTEAIAYLSRSLELTPKEDLAAHYALLHLREQVYDRLGLREEQSHDLTTLTLVARKLQDTRRQAEVALRQANYGTMTGNYLMAKAGAKSAIVHANQESESHLRAGGYLEWGKALRLQARYRQARRLLEQALPLAQSRGTVHLEAETLHQLGAVAYFEGDYDAAIQFDAQALALYRTIGDRQGEARTLDSLGSDASDCGNPDQAITYYEQALTIYRAIGNQWGLGNTLGNLAQIYDDQGEFSRAVACFEQGLKICQAIEDQKGMGWFYGNLGWIYLKQGAYEQAGAAFDAALSLARAVARAVMKAGY